MYGKLFSQMYDGTLGTQGPWEALVTFQQMIILADRDGTVDMTAEALARRTTVPLGVIKLGIGILEQPDPQSRTPDEDGRRIARLDQEREWGWRIVNYAKYRAIRTAEDRREYHRQYATGRRAKRAKSTNVNKPTGVNPKQPIAEAYAKAEVEVQQTPSPNGSGEVVGLDFADFWSAYPRKVGKGDAFKAWVKIKPAAPLVARIVSAAVAQRSCPDWQREEGRFIPHAATWLNRQGWEDEPPQLRKGAFDD